VTEYGDLVELLVQFRTDVIRALAAIDVEISALHKAVIEDRPVDQKRLEQLRDESQEMLERFVEHHQQTIAALH
jgi:hypothetical protein